MNGNARLGVFYALFGGSIGSQGFDAFSDSWWVGALMMVIGFLLVGAAFSQVDKAIKESIRMHDLEKIAKRGR